MVTTIVLGVILGITLSIWKFTRGKEGAAIAVMKGGDLHRFLLSSTGFGFRGGEDPIAKWDIVPISEAKIKPGILQSLFGIYYVGIIFIHSVLEYKFEWVEMKRDKDGRLTPDKRDESTRFVFVKDVPYMGITSRADTSNRLPVDITYVATLQITNPYRALFMVDDWLKRVLAAINKANLGVTRGVEFNDIIGGEKAWKDFSKITTKVNRVIHEYGVKLKKSEIQDISPSGEASKRAVEATAEIYVATQEKQGKAIRSEGIATEIRNIGDAKRDASKSRAEGFATYKTTADIDPTEAMRLETADSIGEHGNVFLDAVKMGLFTTVEKKGGKS